MKTIQHSLYLVLFIFLAVPLLGVAQGDLTDDLQFEVQSILPPFSISKTELSEANTLVELNPYFKPDWVREYISVEISAINNGATKQVVSKNDVLTQAQKDIMQQVKVGSDISVRVHYIPENTLVNNEAKYWDFKFMVNPENKANYVGGEDQLRKYLKSTVIDKIEAAGFDKSILAAVKFSIDENGKVTNVHVFETAREESIDASLVAALNNMPDWQPANYANGVKIQQDFVLTVGNMQSCVLNLLNIR